MFDRRLARILGPFALLLAACSGCSSYQRPSIEVSSIVITDESDEAVALQFALNLQNPNAEPLELMEFNYTLHLKGKYVYTGRRAAQATLRADGRKQIVLPAVVRYDQLPADGSEPVRYTISGSLHYVTPGAIAEILLDTGVRKPHAGFSDSGHIELPRGDGVE